MANEFNCLCKEVLQEWLGQRKRFHPVFDSSKFADPITSFHKLCDSCGPNVTVFHCSNNSMIGAFTSQDWKPKDHTPMPFKTDGKAFLFKMFNKGRFEPRQYPVNDQRFATYCDKDCGPAFGGDRERREIETYVTLSEQLSGTRIAAVTCSISDTFAIDRESKKLLEQSLEGGITKFEVFQTVDDDCYIDKEWRNVSDVSVESLKKELIQVRPNAPDLDHFKLLLVGQIGAGKSSFINSVRSAFKGHVSSAISTGSDRTSLTMENTEHRIRNEADRSFLPFRIWDTKGLEKATMKSQENNIIHIIKGQPPNIINKMWTYVSSRWIEYREPPHELNKVHCVTFVIDGTGVGFLSPDLKETFENIRRSSVRYGVPQVVLLTKVDQVCPMVCDHPALTFHSKAVRDAVDQTAQLLGISRLHIFPVKNYEHECELETAVDRLTLLSIRQMIRIASDNMDDTM